MIEILISSTVLILMICGIRTFWKGKINLHLKYALWLLVVIRLLPLGLFTETTTLHFESPISIMSTFNHFCTTFLKFDSNLTTQRQSPSNETTFSKHSHQTSTHTDQSNNTISNTTNSPLINNNLEVKLPLSFLKTLATTIWYSGMLLSTLWILYVNIRFQNAIKKDRKLLDHVTCKLPVYASSSIHSPMLLVVNGRLGIYVTPACTNDASIMKHALTHELCHYKHLDYLWSFIRCILLIVYWFDPFVWLAAILSKRDCELSCDAATLMILGDEERCAYGKTILEFVAVHNEQNYLLNIAIGMSESKSGIKERIQQITQKPKMMLGTCITLFVIIIIAIITTFTTTPKKTAHSRETTLISEEKRSTTAEEKNPATTEEKNPATTEEKPTDLSKLMEDLIQSFDAGYYFNGDQMITPTGPIESLSDFTDDMIVNKYFGMYAQSEEDRTLDDGFTKSFSKLVGVSYWVTIDAAEETSITIDYSTTATPTNLKTLIILPDQTIIPLKDGESNTITLPQGTSEIDVVAFNAVGEVNLKFSNLTDAVTIQNWLYNKHQGSLKND